MAGFPTLHPRLGDGGSAFYRVFEIPYIWETVRVTFLLALASSYHRGRDRDDSGLVRVDVCRSRWRRCRSASAAAADGDAARRKVNGLHLSCCHAADRPTERAPSQLPFLDHLKPGSVRYLLAGMDHHPDWLGPQFVRLSLRPSDCRRWAMSLKRPRQPPASAMRRLFTTLSRC